MSSWRTARLGDEAEILTGYPFKSAEFTEEQSGIRLLRGDNVVQRALRWDGVKRWPSGHRDTYGKYLLCSGDVVLAMDRPWIEAGLKVADVRSDSAGALLVQRVARLRGSKVLDQGFLKWVLYGRAFTDYVLSTQTGTAVPHISKQQIADYLFPLPPLPVQRRIAGVLGAFDDLIETNRQYASHVRDLSANLYSVLAKRAGAEITLGEVAAINPGKVRPGTGSIRYIDIASMGDGSIDIPDAIDWADAPSRARVAARPGATLWSTVRPNRRAHGLLVEAPPDLVVSTGVAVLSPTGIGPAELFAATDRDDFVDQLVAMAGGSAYPAVRPGAFADVTVPFLEMEASAQFERVMWPLWQDVHAGLEENRRLTRARDELLPLLMSGRVRVRERVA